MVRPVMPWKPRKPSRVTAAAVIVAGGPAVVGRTLEISTQAVSQWRRVPERWLDAFSRLSGVAPERLRPDLFRKTARRARLRRSRRKP